MSCHKLVDLITENLQNNFVGQLTFFLVTCYKYHLIDTKRTKAHEEVLPENKAILVQNVHILHLQSQDFLSTSAVQRILTCLLYVLLQLKLQRVGIFMRSDFHNILLKSFITVFGKKSYPFPS